MTKASAEKRSLHNQTYYKNGGKEKIQARKRAHIARNQAIIRDLREQTPCADCGESYPWWVMDFDHVEVGSKVRAVSVLAVRPVSEEVLRAEIAKCEIVCANCHRHRTHQRRQAPLA